MKKSALILGIIASLAFGQIANATPITTNYLEQELNWATWTASTNNNDDPLGTPSFTSTDVTLNGSVLQDITFNGSNIDKNGTTVLSGDLFINVLLAPGDTTWDYVVRALGTTLNGSANLGLYSINVGLHDTTAYTFSSYPYGNYGNPGIIRADLPVGLKNNPAAADLIPGTVNYSANSTAITFDFTSLTTPLDIETNFIIGYTVTCANDVIYQEVPVPEPGTLVLFGFGLVGLAIYGKRRMNK